MNEKASGQKNTDQDGRPIFRILMIPLLILLLLQAALLAGGLSGSRALRSLNENEQDVFNRKVETRKNQIQSGMIGRWMQLDDLSARIDKEAESLSRTSRLNIGRLDRSSEECLPLLEKIVPDLLSALQHMQVSGVFVLFNTQDLSDVRNGNAFGKRPGIWIRDNDPMTTSSGRNEDLLFELAPTEMVREMSIATDTGWAPLYAFSEEAGEDAYDFFYKPWQKAYEEQAKEDESIYGYWSTAPVFAGTPDSVTYSIPLILSDGIVYGVLGIELTQEYLGRFLPYTELYEDGDAAYVIGSARIPKQDWKAPEEITVSPLVVQGKAFGLHEAESLSLSRISGNVYLWEKDGIQYNATVLPLEVYSNNAPFEEERLLLTGVVEEGRIGHLGNRVRNMLAGILSLVLAVGLLGYYFISKQISGSIRVLSEQVEAARSQIREPVFSRTGIREIDTFADTISTLSKERTAYYKREKQITEHERDYDFLTGLKNRRAFYRSAEEAFSRVDTLRCAAMIMLDLDDLKGINDRYGHDSGDRYIREAARTFKKAVPGETILGRVSGDEFYALLYGYDSPDEIRVHLDTLRKMMHEGSYLRSDGTTDHIRASGGVAWYPFDSTDFGDLMKMADFAMYQAKQDGKDRIEEYDAERFDLQTTYQKSLEQLDELFHREELMTHHFMPIISAKDGSIFAYEALMRIAQPLLRNPNEVLKLASRTHRMHDVEALTWRRAFVRYRELLEENKIPKGARILLNSIASECLTEDEVTAFVSDNADLMDRLIIEITEGESMSAEATEKKRRIPGFRGEFALDDYGSAYNSQKMLLELEPKYVKVDISIVRDIDTSHDKQMIVDSIVKYGHDHDMWIIAEGLETAAEIRKVKELGVDYLQGFFLARPAPEPVAVSEEALRVIME